MLKIISVFMGGGIGALIRYLANCQFKNYGYFSTLLVNIAGSFIAGFAFYYLAKRLNLPQEFRLFLIVGFCGGLTTFSTFALENYNFLVQGEIFKSILYMSLSVILTISAVILGAYFAKQF